MLSQATCSLVEQDLPEGVSLRDLGEHRLKDLGRPMRLSQLVISDLPADFPSLHTLESFPNNLPVQPTPFLGREHEMAALRDLLHREDGLWRLPLAVELAGVESRIESGVVVVLVEWPGGSDDAGNRGALAGLLDWWVLASRCLAPSARSQAA